VHSIPNLRMEELLLLSIPITNSRNHSEIDCVASRNPLFLL